MFANKMIATLLVLASILALSSAQGSCPHVLRRYSARHTYCLPQSTCNIVKRGVTEEDKQKILRLHNEYRNKLAMGQEQRGGGMPTASNMMEMVWDDELARVAQKLTDSCVYGHDCHPCRQVERFLVGQNLFRRNGLPRNVDTPDWDMAMSGWYDEVQHFHHSRIKPFDSSSSSKATQVGHFTQIAWDSSWKIGCAWTLYDDPIPGSQYFNRRSYHACNYGPRGNFEGGQMYKTGPTCSTCPPNSCCGPSCSRYGIRSDYPGLCKVINTSLPPEGTAPVVKNAIFYCGFMGEPDCEFEKIEGRRDWKTFNSEGDNFIEIVLNGGESTTLTFQKRFRTTSNSHCFHMLMRRAPDRDGDGYASTFVSKFLADGQVHREMETRQMPQRAWQMFTQSRYNVYLPKNKELQYSLTFSVPPGAAPQYVNVKRVYIEPDMCGYD